MELTLFLVFGLIALIIGAEFLIKGASGLALSLGISPLIVGLTVVALGTSAPELVVSIKATLIGNSNIAIANVVGSNIFNVLFVLGLCAIASPLLVRSQLVKLDLPIMVLASFLCLVFALDGALSFIEGAFFCTIIVTYTYLLINKSRHESKKTKEELLSTKNHTGSPKPQILKNILSLSFGLAIMLLGGDYFVEGAIQLAKYLGFSDTIIGLTVVAIGTSLPEVVASLMATIKGERDLAIGNVVGSNIYNIFLILGLSSMLSNEGLTVSQELINFDIPVMIAASIACLPIFAGLKMRRWEGLMFFSGFVVYTTYLILKSTHHSMFNNYNQALQYLIVPTFILVFLAISFNVVQKYRKKLIQLS
ncbi:MAG: calcium/sodium antiporter [Oligoflexales bacterium]|nr:calcium/sodium antiporter [Oligoflexales bacterium]